MKRKLPIGSLPLSNNPKTGSSKQLAADPFFYMPYEAAQSQKSSDPQNSSKATQNKSTGTKNKKPTLGVLLGGKK
jgi:hypothetical protein